MVLENLLYTVCSTDGVREPAIYSMFSVNQLYTVCSTEWCWRTCYIHYVLLMVLENLLYTVCSTEWCWITCYIHYVLLMVLENLLYTVCSTDGVGEPSMSSLRCSTVS